ncbi:hypothetical protein BU17DRAFT_36440 [Hysterangium stoloniferum]|nr:hypothetical protein BU17DRAFT_36440 [Hysterangium stoloniferum]
MTWSDSVAEQFSLVNLYTTDESDFYGPYNTLLFELFRVNEHYQVSPQFKRITGSMDFTVLYVVSRRKVPVFFVDIKTYIALDKLSSRMEADDQMRKRFVEFVSGNIPIPKLVGLSAMGTRFSVYQLTTTKNNELLPVRIMPDARFVTDTAPRAWWNHDILDAAGEAKLREIVAEVKAMSVGLNP